MPTRQGANLWKNVHVATLQLTADDYLACCIDAMNLEN